ncbi:uncharacterized protein LOC129745802 [Uranotaenia lowii]|uniref:uncharacterized protein LOC129745802 n=1 Tax=Uranotaenia lowii TaxID=190385 RepID=UPI00247A0A9A|nr:uncharacterized protein LOC129745802 [Uranotaenia lowii]
MEYRGFFKNASRGDAGNRMKQGNMRAVRNKRESSRQELHFTNRNLNASDLEFGVEVESENDYTGYSGNGKAAAPLNDRTVVLDSIQESSRKQRRRSKQRQDVEEDKENDMRAKYEERLARLKRFKEERAKAKEMQSGKKKPFIAVVSKTVDREYEKGLFKKSEAELRKLAEKRKLLTPAAKAVTPRVDTRRREPLGQVTEDKQTQNRALKHVINHKTPASIRKAASKVDTWRKAGEGATTEKRQAQQYPSSSKNNRQQMAAKAVRIATAPEPPAATRTAVVVASRKGTTKAQPSAAFSKFLEVRSGQKSTTFNFKFTNDGHMVTSTNRKKKSLERMLRANAPTQLPGQNKKPKKAIVVAAVPSTPESDDVFEGISPIDVDSPTPKKPARDAEMYAIVKRESRRRSMVFKIEDVKKEPEPAAAPIDDWEPQVITISDDDSFGRQMVKKEPQLNESFTIEIKEERLIDRRPTIDGPSKPMEKSIVIESGRKSLDARPSLIFVEEVAARLSEEPKAPVDSGRLSLGFVEERNVPNKIPTIEVLDSPIHSGVLSPSRRTPRMSFVEEEIPKSKPLPEGNLATVLLHKQQESKRRNSSGGSRRSSIGSFREEEQAPSDVREKVRFYYDLVDKESQRLQELCDLYKDDLEIESLDENSRGLIIAAQGQTNILINKKLSKFRELVGHYERSWADQKVRTDDLDGFWLMVSLDLENLDRRFEELRLLKQNDWQEVIDEPKVKKLKGGGGIKKREKKPMKTKATGLADLIKKAREEAKKKKMMESALTETVTVVTPIKRSVRIATTPRRSSIARNSICTGCTPTSAKSNRKNMRKTIFNDHTLRCKEIVKSILKTPGEKRRAKSVLFLDSGLDTPEVKRTSAGTRKIVHTPKPKITFNEELEVEDVETISLTTPYKLEDEIRKRRRSSIFHQQPADDEQQCAAAAADGSRCSTGLAENRRRTLRFSAQGVDDSDETHDQVKSPVAVEAGKPKRNARGKARGKVSFL